MSQPLSHAQIRTIADANLRKLLIKADTDHAELAADPAYADLATILNDCRSALSTLAIQFTPPAIEEPRR